METETQRQTRSHASAEQPLLGSVVTLSQLAAQLGVSVQTLYDVFSRVVAGWNISDVRNIALVDDALTMALNRRGATHGLVHHSDRGSQYTSYAFGQHLIDADIAASMGPARSA